MKSHLYSDFETLNKILQSHNLEHTQPLLIHTHCVCVRESATNRAQHTLKQK